MDVDRFTQRARRRAHLVVTGAWYRSVAARHTDPENNVTGYRYNSACHVDRITDGRSNETYIDYDAHNRVTAVTRRIDGTTTNDIKTTYEYVTPDADCHKAPNVLADGVVGKTIVTDPNGNRRATAGTRQAQSSRRSTVGEIQRVVAGVDVGVLIDQVIRLVERVALRPACAARASVGTVTPRFAVFAPHRATFGAAQRPNAYSARPPATKAATGTSPSGPTGATTFTYDQDGNQLTGGTNATYDDKGRVATLGGSAMTHLSSTNAELTGLGSSTFQNTLLGVSTITVSGNVSRIQRSPDDGAAVSQTRDFARRWFVQDHLGSTIALASSTGSIERKYDYTVDGEDTPSGNGPATWIRYAGGHDLGNGLYHFGQRYYNPPHRRGGVDPLVEHHEINLARLQSSRELEQMLKGSAQAIELGDDELVANARDCEGLLKLGTARELAARGVDEHALAARRGERVALGLHPRPGPHRLFNRPLRDCRSGRATRRTLVLGAHRAPTARVPPQKPVPGTGPS